MSNILVTYTVLQQAVERSDALKNTHVTERMQPIEGVSLQVLMELLNICEAASLSNVCLQILVEEWVKQILPAVCAVVADSTYNPAIQYQGLHFLCDVAPRLMGLGSRAQGKLKGKLLSSGTCKNGGWELIKYHLRLGNLLTADKACSDNQCIV